jgi:hypothetical protein
MKTSYVYFAEVEVPVLNQAAQEFVGREALDGFCPINFDPSGVRGK